MTRHGETARIERYDSLSDGERAELLRHARSCATCRERLTAADPTRLFGMLALQPIPQVALDRLDAGLDRELARHDRRRRGGSWRRAAAALAASLVLAGFMGLYVSKQRATFPLAAIEVQRARPAIVARDVEPLPGGVELISSPGDAQIMELYIGETQVVMIFDEALDI